MIIKNVFEKDVTATLIDRIEALDINTQPQWGKMNVAQMLAHCNVTYELVYDNIHPKPRGLKKFLVKLLIKNLVVNEKPFKKNTHTAPHYLMVSQKDFEFEKERLIAYLNKTQALGANHFEGLESHTFGPLSAKEWNNMFYKHLDHHLVQFGV